MGDVLTSLSKVIADLFAAIYPGRERLLRAHRHLLLPRQRLCVHEAHAMLDCKHDCRHPEKAKARTSNCNEPLF